MAICIIIQNISTHELIHPEHRGTHMGMVIHTPLGHTHLWATPMIPQRIVKHSCSQHRESTAGGLCGCEGDCKTSIHIGGHSEIHYNNRTTICNKIKHLIIVVNSNTYDYSYNVHKYYL